MRAREYPGARFTVSLQKTARLISSPGRIMP
ncbi:hypothetical protein CKAH01_11987 [Colletotrichum kahawae]|uniref:Uncharacterized protein n=1 Tax=Colletotrichum kahawae TaxID=34407 RepID=A0AAD9YUL0_COLKA|nr:hypothetical protein CKAH01_16232 [Colletotrichum kahawae]KAK2774599.1 hypothetical protein CKAH01_13174 [Colletotrichum kahawae]KAK2777604.1 hypothetical protein CKAH01_11987 [Colletotrichum kahawae]